MFHFLFHQIWVNLSDVHHFFGQQKERELMQEAKKKTEEMKMKLFNVRAQKSDLDNRVLEMQSILSSLRDEQRTIELAFQEKQNEATLLRDQYMKIKDQKPQVEALTEALHQKEAEIEDLKHRLQLDKAAKAGSTSMDEHSKKTANMSSEESGSSISGRNETNSREEVNKLEKSQERSVENQDLEMDKFRGKHKHGYLKRARGKRWRTMDKQTVKQINDHVLGEGFKIQNSSRLQNEPVSNNHQNKKDDKLPDDNFDESRLKETMAGNNDRKRDNRGEEDEPDGRQMELGEDREDKEQADEPEY